MYDLTRFTLKDMTACGAALRQMGRDATSMEQVADRTVRYLYDTFVDGAGNRAAISAVTSGSVIVDLSDFADCGSDHFTAY